MSSIIKSRYPEVTISDVSLPEFVLAGAEERADRPALIDGASGRTITYAQLAGGARKVAAALAARGLRHGEVFAIYSPNVPEYALAYYGVLLAGGTNTTINPLYTADELATQLADAEAKFLLTVPPFAAKALEAAEKTGVQELFILGDTDGIPSSGSLPVTPFAELLRTDAPMPDVTIDPANDLASLPYSSGTTGLPKGVMLTHRNIVANLLQSHGILALQAEERVISVLPFYHIYGQTVLLAGGPWNGATLVTMARFDLEQFLQIMQDQRITWAYLVPPIILALVKHPLVDRYDLSALKYICSGAAPLDKDLEIACGQRLGCLIHQGYGLTEASPVLTTQPADDSVIRHGSAGLLLPNTEAKIVDPLSGDDLVDGRNGELCFRGPQVMRGYLNRPEETAQILDSEGWLHTGDIGHIDDDGYIYVVDRVKELIKYKGLQIAPAELEAVLLSHPDITDAAVVRYPDPEAGEIPKAFVVAGAELTEQAVMDYVAARVAPYMKIRKVEFIDEIPKAASGKILRRVLVERAVEK
jgi:acyl-CoA synthetase (AMP-forming)/AMP-acid ligase II